MHTIITIARQFGSGGRQVGIELAQRCGIPFYDKELLEIVKQNSDLHPDVLESADEKANNSLLYALATGSYLNVGRLMGSTEPPVNDQLFFLQSDAIRKLADTGPCVIVGRCSDYVLREHPRAVHVFLHAPMEARRQRIQRLYDLPQDRAEARILRTDKQRANYYYYYTDRKWGRATHYDLAIDTAATGVDGAVDVIVKFIERVEAHRSSL